MGHQLLFNVKFWWNQSNVWHPAYNIWLHASIIDAKWNFLLFTWKNLRQNFHFRLQNFDCRLQKSTLIDKYWRLVSNIWCLKLIIWLTTSELDIHQSLTPHVKFLRHRCIHPLLLCQDLTYNARISVVQNTDLRDASTLILKLNYLGHWIWLFIAHPLT